VGLVNISVVAKDVTFEEIRNEVRINKAPTWMTSVGNDMAAFYCLSWNNQVTKKAAVLTLYYGRTSHQPLCCLQTYHVQERLKRKST
jgi:hypothetical protein